jgi:UDP-N-acetylmuramoyl-tripeptide--D-alanyl-D-alanine ligase
MEFIHHLYSHYLDCPVVSTDSRTVEPGCLFFGLKGEKTDGSAFGAIAIDLGAKLAIVRRGFCAEKPGVIFVEDPLNVLQILAAYHRKHLALPVVAITGSNGKTTTKELVFRVLSRHYSVCATKGNLNNHIGVPLTLLSFQSAHQIAIVEMGANHPGEIRFLCQLAQPTHGIITNIGKAHLEGFGGIEGVMRAKGELYESIAGCNGVAFVNKNEAYLTELSSRISQRVFYGYDRQAAFAPCDFSFVRTHYPAGDAVQFRDENDKEWTLTSTLFGEFNLANIATAIATGLFFHVPGQGICDAISGYVPVNNRTQRIMIGSNALIMDAYNANPTSMASAIESLSSVKHPKKMMILGAMMELGTYSANEHMAIAGMAADMTGVTTTLIGEPFREPAKKFGMSWYQDVDALISTIKENKPENTLILIKGSRAMQLERLLAAFK